jgi:hypothetical protein
MVSQRTISNMPERVEGVIEWIKLYDAFKTLIKCSGMREDKDQLWRQLFLCLPMREKLEACDDYYGLSAEEGYPERPV